MNLRVVFALLSSLLSSCASAESKTSDAGRPQDANMGEVSDGSASPADSANSDAEAADASAAKDAGHVPTDSSAPMPDYAEIAVRACEMAGGSCDGSLQTASSVSLDSLGCGPNSAGIACARLDGDCGIANTGRCCLTTDDGQPTARTPSCDRGYPVCPPYNDAWLSAGSCEDRSMEVGLPTESSPTRWQGAVSVLEATRWACSQIGGVSTPPGETCDGRRAGFGKVGVETCCVEGDRCPDAYVDTECCDSGGDVVEKACINGRAVCDATFIAIDVMREVKAGTCAPFVPSP